MAEDQETVINNPGLCTHAMSPLRPPIAAFAQNYICFFCYLRKSTMGKKSGNGFRSLGSRRIVRALVPNQTGSGNPDGEPVVGGESG